MKNRRLLLIILVLVLAGCNTKPASSLPEHSNWTGTVALPDGITVPLRMDLDFGPKPSGFFLIGDEKSPIPEITRIGDQVTLRFSEYSAEIRAAWNGIGLVGNYLRIRSEGTKSFKFSASPEGLSQTTTVSGTPAVPPPDGNYQVLFQGEDKVDDSTVAKLWTRDGVTYGTFIAPDGDYGLLVGKPSGKGFQFSRFTGWQAIAIVIEPQGDTWTGTFYAAANSKPQRFILHERADLNVAPPAAKQTVMKGGKTEFTFAGRGPGGETIRNTDDRFKGKALLIDIMGTWCHNCLDEAPVLQKLQERFGKDGLEIVGLSFEISDDPAVAKKNLELYKNRFGLSYTLLFCGSLDDENIEKQVHSQLDNFIGYPTAIFIDKNHKVRSIHGGFKGPGTGEEFQSQIREFEELARGLVQ